MYITFSRSGSSKARARLLLSITEDAATSSGVEPLMAGQAVERTKLLWFVLFQKALQYICQQGAVFPYLCKNGKILWCFIRYHGKLEVNLMIRVLRDIVIQFQAFVYILLTKTLSIPLLQFFTCSLKCYSLWQCQGRDAVGVKSKDFGINPKFDLSQWPLMLQDTSFLCVETCTVFHKCTINIFF